MTTKTLKIDTVAYIASTSNSVAVFLDQTRALCYAADQHAVVHELIKKDDCNKILSDYNNLLKRCEWLEETNKKLKNDVTTLYGEIQIPD